MKSATAIDMLSRAQAIHGDILNYRRAIHSHPELSFEEEKTARLVEETLTKYGYQIRRVPGTTGVIADRGQGKRFAIRADMDALPIQEDNSAEYTSTVDGVMHACGHDVHTACAMGAAKLLADAQDEGVFKGAIRFLFQPAEETINADGKSGATLLIEDGALDGVEALIALHVDPRVAVGQISLREGPVLAACDSFDIKVIGKGTHGAWPELGVDAVVLSSNVIQTIQTIVSRRKPAVDPMVITIGGIRSSTYRPNIICDEVELTGTARYFSPESGKLARTEIENACRMIEALGGSYKLDYRNENPALINNSLAVGMVRKASERLLGKDSVVHPTQELGAEDFAFYTDLVPSCFFFLGVAKASGKSYMLHTPQFDINEDALAVGSALLAETIIEFSRDSVNAVRSTN